ncbi:MAG: RNA polymerase subunit sigma-24 [Planctomycetes bacterium]|nr:RNA polymerase subunit sigma-24 [Planctomycetota bacterium]
MSQVGRNDWVRSVVAAHERPLIAYATRLLGDAERARDVVQETFLRMVRDNGQIPVERPAAWLFTVCRNLARDVGRKEQRMAPLTDAAADREATITPGPAQVLERKETSHALVQHLGHLPEKEQEVIRLKFQGGLTYREISEITGHSVTNVGFLIHHGLRALKERVAGTPLKERLS